MYGHKMKQVDLEVWEAWMNLVRVLKDVFIKKNIYSKEVFYALDKHAEEMERIRVKKAERLEIIDDLAKKILFCQFLNQQDNDKFGEWDRQGTRT